MNFASTERCVSAETRIYLQKNVGITTHVLSVAETASDATHGIMMQNMDALYVA